MMELPIQDIKLAEVLRDLCAYAQRSGGQALVVGGAVRDALLRRPVKDVDVEVYGIAPERLKQLLAERYPLDLVGAAFGVIKIHGLPIDISIPRRESKAGLGHRGFDVMSDPALPVQEAAARRDFTINSMAYDCLTGWLFDPFGGERDLRARILRHTSERFVDDPLRVLRGMQFAARFELTPADETITLCSTMGMEGLSPERVFEEWRKLVVEGIRPSLGLSFLRDCTWIRFFPELNALVGCVQDPEWHPEGDVWTHTLLCMDAFARERTGDPWEDLVVGLAVLCHDFGKPATTVIENVRIRSLGHSEAGEAPTRAFLGRMTSHRALVDQIVPLVVDHLRPVEFFEAQVGDGAIRRLACRVGRIDRLVRTAAADQQGRGPISGAAFEAGDWLLARAHELHVRDSAPAPIVMGRHLIALGMEPGPAFGPILRECFDAQVAGEFATLEEGLDLAKRIIHRRHGESAEGSSTSEPAEPDGGHAWRR